MFWALKTDDTGVIVSTHSGWGDAPSGTPPGWTTVSEALYQKIVPGSIWTGTDVVPPAPTVASATAALGALLAQKQGAGIYFTPTGASTAVLFPTSPAALPLLIGAWGALVASPPLAADGDTYLAADGTPVALSMVDAKAMITKAVAYFRACNAAYAVLHRAVAANLMADITGGWPANT